MRAKKNFDVSNVWIIDNIAVVNWNLKTCKITSVMSIISFAFTMEYIGSQSQVLSKIVAVTFFQEKMPVWFFVGLLKVRDSLCVSFLYFYFIKSSVLVKVTICRFIAVKTSFLYEASFWYLKGLVLFQKKNVINFSACLTATSTLVTHDYVSNLSVGAPTKVDSPSTIL